MNHPFYNNLNSNVELALLPKGNYASHLAKKFTSKRAINNG